MEFKTAQWSILRDDEKRLVWNTIYAEFHFHPSYRDDTLPTFRFPFPVDAYALCDYSAWQQNETANKETMKAIFTECMGDDEYMYALDWQHTDFRYNPRIEADIEYPVFAPDSRYSHGGYNVYFPGFYPDGDYYFFIGKEFTWGYLTHPWRRKAWAFGDSLMRLMKTHAEKLRFVPCAE